MAPRIELRANYGATVGLVVFAVMFAFMLVIPSTGVRVFIALLDAFMIFMAVKLAGRRLVLDEHGVTAKGAFSTSTISWNELDHYTFWSMDQQAVYAAGGAQAGLAGIIIVAIVAAVMASKRNKGDDNRRFAMGRLTLFGQSGRKIHIDARYKRPVDVLDPAFEEMHSRQRAAGRRDYAPFTLGPTELHHATKGTLALPDIEKISIASSQLIIKKRGKRLAWARVHMKNVHNGLLFIEELGERGLTVDAKAGMFVPPTVLEKLRAATARQAALPAARIVQR